MPAKKTTKKATASKSKLAAKKPKAVLKKSAIKSKAKKTTKTVAKKSRKVAPIPKGYTAITPYLISSGLIPRSLLRKKSG